MMEWEKLVKRAKMAFEWTDPVQLFYKFVKSDQGCQVQPLRIFTPQQQNSANLMEGFEKVFMFIALDLVNCIWLFWNLKCSPNNCYLS